MVVPVEVAEGVVAEGEAAAEEVREEVVGEVVVEVQLEGEAAPVTEVLKTSLLAVGVPAISLEQLVVEVPPHNAVVVVAPPQEEESQQHVVHQPPNPEGPQNQKHHAPKPPAEEEVPLPIEDKNGPSTVFLSPQPQSER